MGLVESAGAPYVTAGNTNVVNAASFTPTAGSLIVAIAACGNGNQITGTSIAISDTFSGSASGSWTTLQAYAGTGGSGLAGVWVKDAGASPGAGVVTVTASPSTCLDMCLIVRQFAGAKPAAQQNGASSHAEGTISTISVTPNASGSQIVGAYGNGNSVTGTNNAATTGYGNTNGASGSSEGCFEGASLTTAGTAQVLGVTVAEAVMALAAAEILATPPAAGGPPPIPGFIATMRHQDSFPVPPQNTAQIPPTVNTPVNPTFPGFIAWSRREPLSPVPPLVLVQGIVVIPPVPPQFLRTAVSPQRAYLRLSRGRFFSPGQFNLIAPVLPSFTRQAHRQRLTLRRSQGKFQPSPVQGNQGIQFPLWERQAGNSSRWTLRRTQGKFFNPGQWNLDGNAWPSFTRQAGIISRWTLRRSHGTFFNQSWGQANQGVQFPLFTRQPSPRITLRRSQGRFFSPGQFNLDGNPYPGFTRQAQRTRITLRRSQGKFFSQEWGQGNQGIQFPLYLRQARSSAKWGPLPRRGQWFNPGWGQGNQGVQFPLFLQQEQTRRLTVRYPRGQFQFVPVPPPVTAVFTPVINPVPGFIAVQRHLLDLFPAQAFAQGFVPPQATVPQFAGRAAPRALPRISRGRFANPGQFNLVAPQYPSFTRTASRPVPAKIRRGHFSEPGQFNETAANLPQFIRTAKRPALPVRRGNVFQFPFAPPPPPQYMSTRRPKPLPPRRGKFEQWNIRQAVIPVWPPEFRTTRRVNFTKIRRGLIIQLVPFQIPTTSTLSVTVKLGNPRTPWVTGGAKANWKTGP